MKIDTPTGYVVVNNTTNVYFSYFTPNKFPMFFPNIVFAYIFTDKKKAEDTIKKIISAEPMSKQYFSLEPLEITAS